MPDAHIDTDHPGLLGAVGDETLDLDGKRHVPAVGGAGNRGGQDPGGACLQAPSELPGGLMGMDSSDAWEYDVVAVGLDADRACGEPAGGPGAMLGLAPGEADPAAVALAVLGVRPVRKPAGQIAVQAQVHMTRFRSTRIPRVAGPTRPRRRPGGLRRRAWRGWADFQVRSDQAIRRHWTAGVLRVLVLLAVAAQRMVVLAGGQQGGDLDPQGFQDGDGRAGTRPPCDRRCESR